MNIQVKPSQGIKKALDKINKLHKGHRRKIIKGIVPYTEHLIGVADILSRHTGDEEIIISGLLHDSVEDTDYTFKELRRDFGERVESLVKGVTEDMSLKKMPDKRATWKKRKTLSLEYLKKEASQDVLMLSLADRTNNLKCLLIEHKEQGDGIFDKFNAPKQEQAWLFDSLYSIYKERIKSDIIKEFEKVYKDVKQKVFGKKCLRKNV